MKLALATRNAAVDAVAGLIDGDATTLLLAAAGTPLLVDDFTPLLSAGALPGSIEVRTGAMPASPDAADSGLLLAILVLPTPAFEAAVNGTASPGTIDPVVALLSGTAGHFRIKDHSGQSLIDGSVSTDSTTDLILSSTIVISGGFVTTTGLRLTMPA